VGIILSLNTKNIYIVGYLSKNKITNNLKMNQPYSFSIDQMNGIVEDTYAKIINECENLKKNISFSPFFFLEGISSFRGNLN